MASPATQTPFAPLAGRAGDGSRGLVRAVLHARDAVFNDGTKRAWIATVLGSAVFTPLFWLSVVTGLSRLTLPHGEPVDGYAAAVVGLYFGAVLVAGPLLAHTAGFVLDRATSRWRRDDAVVAFVVFGALLAVVAVLLVVGAAGSRSAFVPALWMFGLPLPLALGIARRYVDGVVESRRWTVAAASVAYAPALAAGLVLLGLYVGHATVPA